MDCLSLDEEDNFVKILQDSDEQTHEVNVPWQMKTIEFRPENPKSITLLLHGYNERGLRIYRKLKRFLPKDTHIIAPNAPFPMPRSKPDRLDFGYAWNFYNDHKGVYHTDEKVIVSMVISLLKQRNPDQLPVTVIGFSQGGFLAPLLGYKEPNIKHVIGIGCIYRERFFAKSPSFTLDAIHGAADTIVQPESALKEIETLKQKDIHVSWHLIPELKHEINQNVAEVIIKIMGQYGEASL